MSSCPLPQAEAEVSSIVKRFGATGNKVFIGREASEETFKVEEALSKKEFVTFAWLYQVKSAQNFIYSRGHHRLGAS